MLQPPPLAQWLHHLFMGFFSSLISITLQHRLQLPQVLIGRVPNSRGPSSKAIQRETSDPVVPARPEIRAAAAPSPPGTPRGKPCRRRSERETPPPACLRAPSSCRAL